MEREAIKIIIGSLSHAINLVSPARHLSTEPLNEYGNEQSILFIPIFTVVGNKDKRQNYTFEGKPFEMKYAFKNKFWKDVDFMAYASAEATFRFPTKRFGIDHSVSLIEICYRDALNHKTSINPDNIHCDGNLDSIPPPIEVRRLNQNYVMTMKFVCKASSRNTPRNLNHAYRPIRTLLKTMTYTSPYRFFDLMKSFEDFLRNPATLLELNPSPPGPVMYAPRVGLPLWLIVKNIERQKLDKSRQVGRNRKLETLMNKMPDVTQGSHRGVAQSSQHVRTMAIGRSGGRRSESVPYYRSESRQLFHRDPVRGRDDSEADETTSRPYSQRRLVISHAQQLTTESSD